MNEAFRQIESSMVEALNEKMDFILVKPNKLEEIDAKLDGVVKNVKSLEVKSLIVELQKTKIHRLCKKAKSITQNTADLQKS